MAWLHVLETSFMPPFPHRLVHYCQQITKFLSHCSFGSPSCLCSLFSFISILLVLTMEMDLSSTICQFEYPNATSGRRIRLIKVSPGLESEQLAFSISEFELEQSPPFTALSYVWGNVQDMKVAMCNDCSFNITNSL